MARRPGLLLRRRAFQAARFRGRTVVRLADHIHGRKFPEKPLAPTLPSARLPQELLEENPDEWLPLASGRWRLSDVGGKR